MGRKVSIGVVGSGGGLGTIVAGGTGNTLTTAVTNQNLVIDPNGTGITQIVGATQLNAQSELRLADADSSNYIALKAAGTIASNYTLTWPAATAAANGYVLATQTDGTLSWISLSSAGVAVTDPGSSATVHYPIFATNSGSVYTTGQVTAMNNRSNLAFVPSTGELTATAYLGANVYGSAANSGTLTLGGTTSATKATASVLMTDAVASSSTTTGTLVVTGGVGVSGKLNAAEIGVTSTLVFPLTEVAQSTNYTLALTDSNKAVTMNSGSATTVTVPPNSTVAFPTGAIVYVSRIGAGTVTLAAGAGVTLTKTGNLGANETILLRKRDTNTWIVDDSSYPLTASGGTTTSPTGYTLHQFTTAGSATLTVS